MRAWVVQSPGELTKTELTVPRPGPDGLLVRVLACGVCRTDLHVRDHELPPHKIPVVPGHEIVGEVVETGERAGAGPAGGPPFEVGELVGIAWLRSTCGTCVYCLRDQENLCASSRYTGWDEDGGYAEYAAVPAAYAYRLPEGYSPAELAPLLCAGIIGFRALRRAALPTGGRLGIYGFGASAHLAVQVALAEGATVHVATRSAAARDLALELGAASVGSAYDRPPEALDAAILFAPVGELVPVALEALDRGGTLSIAGIYLTDIPRLNYDRQLFQERTVRSVTANTRQDGRDFLALAGARHLRIAVMPYDFGSADRALDDLAADRVRGVAVLTR